MPSDSVASLLSVVSDGCLPHPVYGAVHLVTATFVQPKLNSENNPIYYSSGQNMKGTNFPERTRIY